MHPFQLHFHSFSLTLSIQPLFLPSTPSPLSNPTLNKTIRSISSLRPFNFHRSALSLANPAINLLPPSVLHAIHLTTISLQKYSYFLRSVFLIVEMDTSKAIIFVNSVPVLALSVLGTLLLAHIAIVIPQTNSYTMHHAKLHVRHFTMTILHKFHTSASLV